MHQTELHDRHSHNQTFASKFHTVLLHWWTLTRDVESAVESNLILTVVDLSQPERWNHSLKLSSSMFICKKLWLFCAETSRGDDKHNMSFKSWIVNSRLQTSLLFLIISYECLIGTSRESTYILKYGITHSIWLLLSNSKVIFSSSRFYKDLVLAHFRNTWVLFDMDVLVHALYSCQNAKIPRNVSYPYHFLWFITLFHSSAK